VRPDTSLRRIPSGGDIGRGNLTGERGASPEIGDGWGVAVFVSRHTSRVDEKNCGDSFWNAGRVDTGWGKKTR